MLFNCPGLVALVQAIFPSVKVNVGANPDPGPDDRLRWWNSITCMQTSGDKYARNPTVIGLNYAFHIKKLKCERCWEILYVIREFADSADQQRCIPMSSPAGPKGRCASAHFAFALWRLQRWQWANWTAGVMSSFCFHNGEVIHFFHTSPLLQLISFPQNSHIITDPGAFSDWSNRSEVANV